MTWPKEDNQEVYFALQAAVTRIEASKTPVTTSNDTIKQMADKCYLRRKKEEKAEMGVSISQAMYVKRWLENRGLVVSSLDKQPGKLAII